VPIKVLLSAEQPALGVHAVLPDRQTEQHDLANGYAGKVIAVPGDHQSLPRAVSRSAVVATRVHQLAFLLAAQLELMLHRFCHRLERVARSCDEVVLAVAHDREATEGGAVDSHPHACS